MKITELWTNKDKSSISFELFPARNESAAKKLPKVIDKLANLRPDFVSVTFGAGGTTRDGSYQLVRALIQEKNLEVMPYLAGYGLAPSTVTEIVQSYKELGVDNLLVVRGDAPEDTENFTPHPESAGHASDLLGLLSGHVDLCFGAAAYPEGHREARGLDEDIDFLRLKVNSGAQFLVANYFYDNAYFFDFIDKVRTAGISVPILPGVMPIYNVKMISSLASLCGATITDELKRGLAALPEGDKSALADFGVEFALKQCRGLLDHGVAGLHFYTMNRSKSCVKIVETLRNEALL